MTHIRRAGALRVIARGGGRVCARIVRKTAVIFLCLSRCVCVCCLFVCVRAVCVLGVHRRRAREYRVVSFTFCMGVCGARARILINDFGDRNYASACNRIWSALVAGGRDVWGQNTKRTPRGVNVADAHCWVFRVNRAAAAPHSHRAGRNGAYTSAQLNVCPIHPVVPHWFCDGRVCAGVCRQLAKRTRTRYRRWSSRA